MDKREQIKRVLERTVYNGNSYPEGETVLDDILSLFTNKDTEEIINWCKKISKGNVTSGVRMKPLNGGEHYWIITEEQMHEYSDIENAKRNITDAHTLALQSLDILKKQIQEINKWIENR